MTSSGPDKLAKRPEFDSVEAAARVSSFMEAAEHGRWQISRFTVTDHDVKLALGRNFGRSMSAEEMDMRNARIVPPGEYVSLRRRATSEEGSDLYEDGTPFDGWVPIMSDTPSEIHEHDDAFERAHGNVVITGLGLGVVVSALLAKPEVDHITVVEVDRDVIALTAPYYEDETRVTIVNADALRFAELLRSGVSMKPLKLDHAGNPLGDEGLLDGGVGGASRGNVDSEVTPHDLDFAELLRRKDAARQQIEDAAHARTGAHSPDDRRTTGGTERLPVDGAAEAAAEFLKQWSLVVPSGDLGAGDRPGTAPAVADDAQVAVATEVATELGSPDRVDETPVYISDTHNTQGYMLFDYHWADIWSAISYRNIDDDSLAEHGISYQTMFDAYEPFCVDQSAWALAEAIQQGAVEDARYAKREEFIRAWRAGTPEQRVELLVDGILRDQIGSFVAVDAEIPSDVREHLAGQMGLLAWAQTIVAENGFDIDKLERDLLTPETPMPRPNEAPEANVA